MDFIIVFLVTIILYYIFLIYKSYEKIHKTISDFIINEKVQTNVFYPVYSKLEIESQQREADHKENQLEDFWLKLDHLEKEEINIHHKAGGNAKNFIPSKELIEIINTITSSTIDYDRATANYKKAIEANIQVSLGKSIAEVEKEYRLRTIVGIYSKLQDDYLTSRKKYWEENWTVLINNNN